MLDTINKKIIFAIVCLIFFCITLLVKVPATHLYYRLPILQKLGISGVNGTIWNSQIGLLEFHDIKFERLNIIAWPNISLDTVNLGISTNKRSKNKLIGEVSLSGSELIFENLEMTLEANDVMGLFEIPLPASAAGVVLLEVEKMHWSDGHCLQLKGKGIWQPAILHGNIIHSADFQKFEVDLECRSNKLTAVINPKNQLNLNGVAYFDMGGYFAFEGKFMPQKELPIEVHKAAYLFGQPNANGYFSVAYKSVKQVL